MPYHKNFLTTEQTDSIQVLGSDYPRSHATTTHWFKKGGRPDRDKNSPPRKDNRPASEIPDITAHVQPINNFTVADFFKKKSKKKKQAQIRPLMETKPMPYTLEDAHAAAEELENQAVSTIPIVRNPNNMRAHTQISTTSQPEKQVQFQTLPATVRDKSAKYDLLGPNQYNAQRTSQHGKTFRNAAEQTFRKKMDNIIEISGVGDA